MVQQLRLPRWLSGKEPACQCKGQKTRVQSLGLEDLLEWECLPTPVFLYGKFHGRRNQAGYGAWGHKGSDTTQHNTGAAVKTQAFAARDQVQFPCGWVKKYIYFKMKSQDCSQAVWPVPLASLLPRLYMCVISPSGRGGQGEEPPLTDKDPEAAGGGGRASPGLCVCLALKKLLFAAWNLVPQCREERQEGWTGMRGSLPAGLTPPTRPAPSLE